MIYVVEQAGDLNSFLGRCQRAVFQVPGGGGPRGGGRASSQEGQRREALQSLFLVVRLSKVVHGDGDKSTRMYV